MRVPRRVGRALCWIRLHRWSEVLTMHDESFRRSVRARREYGRICLRVDCHARKRRHVTTVTLEARPGRRG